MEYIPIELLFEIINYLPNINEILCVNKYLFEVTKKYIIYNKFIKVSKLHKFDNIDYCYGIFWDLDCNDTSILPKNTMRLEFYNKFNRHVIVSNSITRLTFGYHFDQPLTVSNSVTHLTFGCRFNQPLIVPNSVTHLTLGKGFAQTLTAPSNLQIFQVSRQYMYPIPIDKNIEIIRF